MKRLALVCVVLVVVSAGTLLSWDARGAAQATGTIALTCSDSAGQQSSHGDKIIGGVAGLVLPGSGDPSSLWARRTASGRRYFVYKAFLSVSPATQGYAIVSVVNPSSAKLYYGSSAMVGTLANVGNGRGLFAAARSKVRLPVCGRSFSGYVGGVVVLGPTSVTFAVTSPHKKVERVTVRVGNG